MKCLIFCSSNDSGIEFLKRIDFSDSYIICADGGASVLQKLGLKADLWVGDMDSYKGSDYDFYKEKAVYPSDKDLTDAHIAVIEALNRNMTEICLFGATGGRLDHEYANYCLLKYILKNGGFGTILNEKNRICLTNKNIKIYPEKEKYISFFPFGGEVKSLTVKNAKYVLQNYDLTDDHTYTVSNEFINEKPVEIELDSGYLLIMCSGE